MHTLKRFVVWLANLSLGVMLFLLAITAILVFTIANTSYINNTLEASGVYKKLVPSIINLVSTQSAASPNYIESQQTINTLKPIIEKVATPQVIQEFSEQAVDGVDAWLASSGKPLIINFEVKTLKDSLNKQVSDYVQSRISQLPICITYSPNFDIFNAACKPAVEIPRAQIDQAVSDYIASLPFLKDDTLVLGSQAKQDVKNTVPFVTAIPKAYRLLVWAPYVFILIGLLCIVILYLSNKDKQKAWHLIGHAFLATGAMLVISGAIAVFFISNNIQQASPNSSAEQLAFTNQIIVPIAKKIINDIGRWSLYFGVSYAIAGGVCYFASHQMKLRTLQKVV